MDTENKLLTEYYWPAVFGRKNKKLSCIIPHLQAKKERSRKCCKRHEDHIVRSSREPFPRPQPRPQPSGVCLHLSFGEAVDERRLMSPNEWVSTSLCLNPIRGSPAILPISLPPILNTTLTISLGCEGGPAPCSLPSGFAAGSQSSYNIYSTCHIIIVIMYLTSLIQGVCIVQIHFCTHSSICHFCLDLSTFDIVVTSEIIYCYSCQTRLFT